MGEVTKISCHPNNKPANHHQLTWLLPHFVIVLEVYWQHLGTLLVLVVEFTSNDVWMDASATPHHTFSGRTTTHTPLL